MCLVISKPYTSDVNSLVSFQVLKMESLILKTINFDLSVPTVVNFLERFVKATECSESDSSKVEALSKVS